MDTYEKIEDLRKQEDVIAVKVWTIGDVEGIMEECGMEINEENMCKVLNRLDVRILESCYDEEWNAIYNAVERNV